MAVQNAFFLTVMGDLAVVMPNEIGEKKTRYSQTLAVFFILAVEDGYTITCSAGKWFKCYIHAKHITDIWTMDKRLNYLLHSL